MEIDINGNLIENNPYTQLCVWKVSLGKDSPEQFEKSIHENFGCKIKFEAKVKTTECKCNKHKEDDVEDDYDELFFYVHKDDLDIFAIARLPFGIRWWEDVIVYNNGSYKYSKEILEKYIPTW